MIKQTAQTKNQCNRGTPWNVYWKSASRETSSLLPEAAPTHNTTKQTKVQIVKKKAKSAVIEEGNQTARIKKVNITYENKTKNKVGSYIAIQLMITMLDYRKQDADQNICLGTESSINYWGLK